MYQFFFTLAAVFTAATVFNAWAFAGAVICALLGACWLQFSQALAKPRSRRSTRVALVRPRGRYRRNVERALDWLDRRLQPSNVEDDGLDRFLPQAPDRAAAERVAAAPCGWPLLDLTLWLALAYPVLLLSVTWVLDGERRLGDDLVILPGEAPPWARIAMSTAVALFALSFVLPSRRRLVVHLFAFGLASAFAMAVAYAVAFAVIGAGIVAF